MIFKAKYTNYYYLKITPDLIRENHSLTKLNRKSVGEMPHVIWYAPVKDENLNNNGAEMDQTYYKIDLRKSFDLFLDALVQAN